MNSESNSQLIIYQSEDGQTRLAARLDDEIVWLSQKLMAELFQTSTDNVWLHLKNIYSEGELSEQPTTGDFSVVRSEGAREVTRTIRHYNLEAIISVGYRIKSHVATRFRQWATAHMREWITKLDGFLQLNDRDILDHAGQVSHELAVEHANSEYSRYHARRLEQETERSDEDFEELASEIARRDKEPD